MQFNLDRVLYGKIMETTFVPSNSWLPAWRLPKLVSVGEPDVLQAELVQRFPTSLAPYSLEEINSFTPLLSTSYRIVCNYCYRVWVISPLQRLITVVFDTDELTNLHYDV